MNDTVDGVPIELLERICTMSFMGIDIDKEVSEIRELLRRKTRETINSLPVSAKVKEYTDVDGDTQYSIFFVGQRMPHGTELVRLSDAMDFIYGKHKSANPCK